MAVSLLIVSVLRFTSILFNLFVFVFIFAVFVFTFVFKVDILTSKLFARFSVLSNLAFSASV